MTLAVPVSTGQATPTATPQELGRWRRLPTKAKVGAILLGLFVLAAIIGPLVTPYDPGFQNPSPALSMHAPDAAHLLGTTQSGQDVLSQLLVGIRLTLELALLVGVIATALSVFVGVTAAFLGGVWDEFLSLVSNVFLVIPALPLLILLLGYLPQKGQLATIVVLSVLGWPWGARVIRAQTLAIRNRDFVAASRETGESTWRIITYEIIPNEISLIAANFVNTVLYAIGTSVALAFIGLANLSSWSLGTMLYWAESQQALQLGAWWWFVPPGLAVALIGTGAGAAQHRHRRAGQPAAARRRQRQPDRRAPGAARRPDAGAGRRRRRAAAWPASCTPSRAARCSATTSRAAADERPAASPAGSLRREHRADPVRPGAGHPRLLGRLPDPRRRRAGRRPCQPRRCTPARWSGWSARAARASPRWPTAPAGCCAPPALITGGSVRYAGRRLAQPADILQLRPDELQAAALAGDRHRVPERDERAQPGAQRPRPAPRRHPRAPEDVQGRRPATRPPRCSTWSASRGPGCAATRTSCPAACASGS